MNADFNRTVQDMRRFSVATSFFFMQQTDYTITNDNVGENCVLSK